MPRKINQPGDPALDVELHLNGGAGVYVNGVAFAAAVQAAVQQSGAYVPFNGVALRPQAGEWITDDSTGSGSVTMTQDMLCCWPLYIPEAFTADRIGGWVTTVQPSALLRLGVYLNGSDERPGTLLFDAGTIDASAGTSKEITISQAIPAGLIWMAVVVQGAASVALLRFLNTTLRVPSSSVSTGLGDKPVLRTRASVSGALPTPAATTATGNNSAPVLGLRRAP